MYNIYKIFYLIALCKPEAANTFRAPDDERYAARNMLSLQMNGGIINSDTRLYLVGYFY